MIPRNMRIDFTGVELHWSKSNPAYATATNGGSVGATAFEPYLNRVMAWARDTLGGKNPALHRDINLFIAQEGHHYRVHRAFNKVLYETYPRVKEFEDELAEALRVQFETRSLEYNLAYCVGFENFACYVSKFIFARALPDFAGANNRMATLWLWHMAEEFEHRAACSDALRAITRNYFVRIRGFLVFLRQVLAWQTRLVDYVLEVDRATMTPEERAASIRLKKRNDRAFARYAFPRMIQIFLPFYDPRGQKAPQALHDALGRYEQVALERQPLTA
jgi:predicted metal-dependent hydrolase